MNKVTIDRELLEQVASEFEHDNDRYMLGRELRKVLAAPRQPEGDGLEVRAVEEYHRTNGRIEYYGLCRLSDAQRAIAELREECERLRMQLAACGVVALANTPESAAQARQMHQDYMSASCSDVANAVDREMALRQQRDKLAELLRMVRQDGWYHPLEDHEIAHIEAALAEVK